MSSCANCCALTGSVQVLSKVGCPSFDKTWTDPVNAQQFAQELIKHTYRDGWALPAMPR